MALPESLSPENVIGTLAAGIAIAIVMVRQYLKERKAPTSPTGDRVIPGITIADMNPIRELASEQARRRRTNASPQQSRPCCRSCTSRTATRGCRLKPGALRGRCETTRSMTRSRGGSGSASMIGNGVPRAPKLGPVQHRGQAQAHHALD